MTEATRRPKNKSEAALFDLMTDDGWELTKRGWPDFVCFKDDDLMLVEVKPTRSHHLKKMQYRVMLALANRGIKCCRWSPESGFELVIPPTLHV